jgi:hypothetical protein
VDASLVSAVALYGAKPEPLRLLLESVRKIVTARLGSAFEPYSLDQVHGTLIVLSGWPDGQVPGAVTNQYFLEHRGIRRAMDLDLVQELLARQLSPPLQIRIGGLGPADPAPFTSRGQHLHERSFSAQAGALVLAGWPAISLRSAGARQPLDRLRRSMTAAGVLHRYHAAPADVDDDFHLVAGHYRDAAPDSVRAAVVAVRQHLARQPVDVQVGPDQVVLVGSDSPTLARPRFRSALPVPASELARQYG